MLVLKNIGLGVGALQTPTSYPRVRTAGLSLDMGKTIVEDTAGTRKGFGRIVGLGYAAAGDITFYAYSDDLGWWLYGVLGGKGSLALASGYKHQFDQADTLPRLCIVADKGVEVVRWPGTIFNTLSLSGATEIIEGSVGALASSEDTGAAYTPTGVSEIDPFTFDQVTVKIGADLAAASGAGETRVDSWEFVYDNQAEARWQSGDKGAARIDPKIALCTGTFTKFYEASDFRDWMVAEPGTERALLLEILGPAIGGTNHKLTIRLPRVEFLTSERPYEAGDLIVETATWQAMYDSDFAYMIQGELTNLKQNYNS